MKNLLNKKWLATLILMVVLLGTVSIVGLTQNKGQDGAVNEIKINSIFNENKNIQCYKIGEYFVIERGLVESVGNDILVKKTKNSLCEYKYESGDFELKNAVAEHYESIYKNFLITDIGTSVHGREFIIYDLESKKEIFRMKYDSGIKVSNNLINYWVLTEKIPTLDNCPDYNEIVALGGSIGISVLNTLNLNDMTIVKGEERCSYRE